MEPPLAPPPAPGAMVMGGRAHPLEPASESNTKRRKYSDVDPHAPPTSKVVHARGVPDGLLSTEMTSALAKYGTISHVVLMPKIRQALVEFESPSSAEACVADAKETGILLRDRPVFFNFSKSQEINRGQSSSRGNVNRILLMTIQNALFPITCDIINTICNKVGAAPLKIVMVRKRGVQALVEFDSVPTATQVKEQLNFQDIYKGCCTLKIEFSHTEALNVQFNSDDTKDYTNPSLPTRSGPSPGAMGNPGGAMGGMGHGPPGGYHMGGGAPRPPQGGYGQFGGYGQHPGHPGHHQQQHPMGASAGMPGMDPYGAHPPGPGGAAPMEGMHAGYGHAQQHQPQYGAPQQQQQQQPHYGTPGPMGMAGTVMVFYELDMTKFNCERLFNLVCLYANPIKVKFVMNKPGMAMVQVSDPAAASTTLHHLTGVPVFGKALECGLSKHDYVAPSRSAGPLADGTPSMLDCPASRNHRFRSGVYQKNRLCPPSTVLHFFNVPKATPHENFLEMFRSRGAPTPISIFSFPDDGKGKSTDRGLMEFESIAHATEALVLCNHAELNTPDQRVYTTKFSFSNNHIEPDAAGVTRFARVGGVPSAPPQYAGDGGVALSAPGLDAVPRAVVAPSAGDMAEEAEPDFNAPFLDDITTIE